MTLKNTTLIILLLIQFKFYAQHQFHAEILYENKIDNFFKSLGLVDVMNSTDEELNKPLNIKQKKQFEQMGFYGDSMKSLKRKIVTQFSGDTIKMKTTPQSTIVFDIKNMNKKIERNGNSGNWFNYEIAKSKIKNTISYHKEDTKTILGYKCYKVIITAEDNTTDETIREVTEMYITNQINVPIHYNVVMDFSQKLELSGLLLEATYWVESDPESKSYVKAIKIDKK